MLLSLQLALKGSRATRGRLVATCIGVALGSCLLLLLAACIHGLSSRDARGAWLLGTKGQSIKSQALPADGLLWNRSFSNFQNRQIYVVSVAPLSDNSPKIPGISNNPRAGEYYVSPALRKLLGETNKNELQARFSGQDSGTISANAVPTPDTLIIVRGKSKNQLATAMDTQLVTTINAIPLQYSIAIKMILAMGIIALLFPITMFIVVSTKLGASLRERRYAALSLIGATPSQMRQFAAVEAALTTTVGITVGLVLFAILKPMASKVSLSGGTFYGNDLAVNPMLIGLLFIVMLSLAIASTVTGLRKIQMSPLGTSQLAISKPPKAWLFLPLLVGIGWQLYIFTSHPTSALLPILGLLIMLIGIVLVGPLLVKYCGLLIRLFGRSAASLIASRRLEAYPNVAFRAISGVVLALFVVSIYSITATSVTAGRQHNRAGGFQQDMVAIDLTKNSQKPEVAALKSKLLRISGVSHVTVAYDNSTPTTNGVLSCADLAALQLGACTDKALSYVALPINTLFSNNVIKPAIPTPTTLPAHPIPQSIFVRTNNSEITKEQVRSVLEASAPAGLGAVTQQDLNIAQPFIKQLQQLGYAGMIASIVISGGSLLVALISSVVERQRSFGLLRLAGMPMRSLGAVVLYETVLPLLALSGVSLALGVLTARSLLSVFTSGSIQLPGAGFYVIIIGSLVFAIAIIAASIPSIRRVTNAENTRFE